MMASEQAASQAAALVPFGEGVWIATGPANIVGMRLTATMALLRLGDGSLVAYSPIELTPERKEAVEALGPLGHVYAPNLFHHTHAGTWAGAFPSARLHAPAALAKKRPDLRIDRAIGDAAEPAFAGVLDERQIAGFRLEEGVLVHRPSGTLVLADLVHNVGRPEQAWAKLYTQWMGFYDRVALSKMLRWTAFSNRAAARRSLDELLGLSFDRTVVGHGTPLAAGAKDALAAAYTWLG
jgi:hypothetical protein